MHRLYKYLLMVAVIAVGLWTERPAYAQTAPTISTATYSTSSSYTTPQSITISASGATTIYYTTDGSNPVTSATKITYSGAFTVSSATQLNAVANYSGTYSPVTTIYLDVDPNLAPVLQTGLVLRLTSGFGLVTTGIGSPNPVAQWTDLSGAGNSATAAFGNQPTVASTTGCNPVVHFNGTSQYFSLPSGFANFTGGGNFFLVVQPAAFVSTERFFDLGNGTASNNIYMSQSSSGTAELDVYNSSTDSSVSLSGAITAGQFQLIEGSYNGSNTATVYSNGALNASSGSMQTAQNLTRSNNFIGQASGSGNFYSGSIAEVLIYNATLTPSQRTGIEAYLMQKYQVLSVVPPAPIISVPTSTLNLPAQVQVSAPAGTTIFVTTDGSTPTTSSPVYTGPINISYTQTLQAICVNNGVSSSVSSATYTLDSTLWPAPSSGDTTAPTLNLQLPVPSM